MNSLKNIKSVFLTDNREIRLNDDRDISISIILKGEILSTIHIPYMSSGYGGGSLHLSPSGSFLLFLFYSGQSEEAFKIFEVRDHLKLIYETEYLFGESASYCFAKDEKTLIQCLPGACSEWWLPWIDDDTEKDDDGNSFFDFGLINVLDIQKRALKKHSIRICPVNDWQPDQSEYDPLMMPELTDDTSLMISMPWGKEILGFPLEDVIIFRPGFATPA